MNRSDLIHRIADLHPQLSSKDAELVVRIILEAMTETLQRGDRIAIRGFGSFSLKYRPPRIGRNPKTGAKVAVPAKYVPQFKVGLKFRKRVDFT